MQLNTYYIKDIKQMQLLTHYHEMLYNNIITIDTIYDKAIQNIKIRIIMIVLLKIHDSLIIDPIIHFQIRYNTLSKKVLF